jgi:hypothetical protein
VLVLWLALVLNLSEILADKLSYVDNEVLTLVESHVLALSEVLALVDN